MSWSTNDNEPEAPEVIFTSSADGEDDDEILFDLWITMHRMVTRRDLEGAHGATSLHLYANATNGYVDLAWLSPERTYIGEWRYTVRFPDLHHKSLNHEQGASFFDQQVRFAAFSLAEDLYCLTEGDGLREGASERAEAAHALQIPAESWEIYFSTELDGALEAIIP
jgi:hypothetical protein